ncbi:hypothetical protein C5167_007276 [Papaver somniferum]|nr:hypothetical protein C5167_007276 [Papaver somniferum]
MRSSACGCKLTEKEQLKGFVLLKDDQLVNITTESIFLVNQGEGGMRKIAVATSMVDTVATTNDVTFVFDRRRSKPRMKATNLPLASSVIASQDFVSACGTLTKGDAPEYNQEKLQQYPTTTMVKVRDYYLGDYGHSLVRKSGCDLSEAKVWGFLFDRGKATKIPYIRSEGLGFVFDRGKATKIPCDTLDNVSCLLRLRISKGMSFVFDCGKSAGCYATGTGVGGTKIDIQTPFTTLQTSIYKAFIKVHTAWAKSMNISVVTPVAPFTACYNSSTLPPFNGYRQTPGVTFVFQKNEWGVAWWDLVKVNDAVKCVGFVDGGLNPLTSIVIGARQIGFAEFDISRSRLGFLQPNFMT